MTNCVRSSIKLSTNDRLLARKLGWGAIYFLCLEGEEEAVKVGRSVDPFKRLYQYVPASHRTPYFREIFYFPISEDESDSLRPQAWRTVSCAKEREIDTKTLLSIETSLHRHLRAEGRRIRGEWYSDADEVVRVSREFYKTVNREFWPFAQAKRYLKSTRESLALNHDASFRTIMAEKHRLRCLDRIRNM